MKKAFILIGMLFFMVATAGGAVAATTYATSVVDYDGYFMNWDTTSSFYHNEVTEYPNAGADLSWLLGAEDQTVAAGWGGDANGGTLTLHFDTGFTADGTDAYDIYVYGFGFAYNTPFNSSEMGAVKVYASSNGTDWTVISEYTGTLGEEDYVANLDFTFSSPGVPSVIMSIDLDDDISNTYDGVISYLKFELGDGETGHGRAFFTSAIEGVNAVPVPAAVWLLGSGLIGLVAIRRNQTA
ncbi:hypothetical protein DSCO28_42210 [Desulfosarcina ovata subsp. sediminis]|uniref:F5/8 type C domain-containing protein n=1 Tax=Desulfosarcina ovata subsp. sediminis TaxID=885957 RepID=A0A5K7ZTV8_9BACT|nr:VPLPA-CTERM sorting domain-containing protein [Desulfosarcina ovata]BBO83655.1 hypothetical protein DSCO28_42210 [Desulfosarcina ovata subsp. sediminis]